VAFQPYSVIFFIFRDLEKAINDVRFEVFTAVTMMNVVFWDITTQLVLHREHVSATESPVA
jgi:endo-1,4-beta-mannosidase